MSSEKDIVDNGKEMVSCDDLSIIFSSPPAGCLMAWDYSSGPFGALDGVKWLVLMASEVRKAVKWSLPG